MYEQEACCSKNSITYKDLVKAKIALEKANRPLTSVITGTNIFTFGNCTSAPTPPQQYCFNDNCMGCDFPKQEQGNNPMRIETNSATAIVSAIKSDEAIQRDYLLDELRRLVDYSWNDTKFEMLREMFNLDAPKYPKSSQELIDAFANGKFTVDQAKVDANTKFYADPGNEGYYDDEGCGKADRFYGITFTGLPVADHTGYEAAVESYKKAQKDTKRTIIVSSPADGLAALVALEAWMPATAPTTATVQ